MNYPRVTVILPAYNAEAYILESVNSVLSQTYSDFILMVIDDGSIDKTFNILSEIRDKRLLLLKNDKNMGLVNTLNRGLRESQSEYIARMDADDISCPTRLEKQLDFLDKNKDYGLCGTWGKSFDGDKAEIMPPTDNSKIKIEMLFANCFIHSSVMMRSKILRLHGLQYSQVAAEDYDLWLKLCAVTKVKNLDEILVYYRVHSEQITQSSVGSVEKSAKLLREKYLSRLLSRATDKDTTSLDVIARKKIDQTNMIQCYGFLCRVLHQGEFESDIERSDMLLVLKRKIGVIKRALSQASILYKAKLMLSNPVFFWGVRFKKIPPKALCIK